MEKLYNVPLKSLTTMGVGGNAHEFIEVTSVKELISAIKEAQKSGLNWRVLGGGSNSIFSDSGYDGLVIKIAFKGISFENNAEGKVLVTAQAGEVWDELVKTCCLKKLWGIENMSAIPGLVGALPIENVGAYGQECADVFVNCQAYDTQEDRIVSFYKEDCDFAYRHSRFNSKDAGRYIILSVSLMLDENGKQCGHYPDVMEYLKGQEATEPMQMRDAISSIRFSKLPHWDDLGSAGSFFKNILTDKQGYESSVESLKPHVTEENLKRYCEICERFVMGDSYKIPTGLLLDVLGFAGYQIGGAAMYETQALIMVNKTGNAKAEDVAKLASHIQEQVKEITGFDLKIEPHMVGF